MGKLPGINVRLQSNDSPHVVILGAGASLAALPRGDRHGRRLPVMSNFVETLGLESLVARAGFRHDANFELIYDALYASPEHAGLRMELEDVVRAYFSAIQIPHQVTLYDEMLLSLREKDIIATFNWDPLLLQAYQRVADLGSVPRIVFLHGNVAVGYCEKDRVKGALANRCGVCHKPFAPSPLLFPIRDKRYRDHPFLAQEWLELEWHLENAYILTVFGYSAPKSDVAARAILLDAWQRNETRELAEIELVDIQSRGALKRSWSDFFVRQHFGISRRFGRTLLMRHPRRSCEAFAWATLQMDPWPPHKLPRFRKLEALREAMRPLLAEEKALRDDGQPLSRNTALARN